MFLQIQKTRQYFFLTIKKKKRCCNSTDHISWVSVCSSGSPPSSSLLFARTARARFLASRPSPRPLAPRNEEGHKTLVSKVTQSFVFGAALDPERRAQNSLFASLISFKGIRTQFWGGPQRRDKGEHKRVENTPHTHTFGCVLVPISKTYLVFRFPVMRQNNMQSCSM